MKYTLSLRTGGLMEDPEWHYENIRTIEANSLKEAKQKYADETGISKDKSWNAENQTLWGWSIVGVRPLEEVEYNENVWS